MSAALVSIGKKPDVSAGRSSQAEIRESAANEFVFAVVGHVGSGTSEVATLLKSILSTPSLAGGPFDTEILKARDVLLALPDAATKLAGLQQDTLEYTKGLQDLGDSMREGDHAAVARALILRVRQMRAKKRGITVLADRPVEPDGARRAYVLDSIRHPAEVELLRSVYQSAFVLVGIVCEEDKRLQRLNRKYTDALQRLVKIITHAEVLRPTLAETAMHTAHGAQIRSACLSRQVGAALIDRHGNLVSTGTNEVPQAGGGVYGEDFDTNDENDHRCAYKNKYCSSTREQNELIDHLVELLVEQGASKLAPATLVAILKDSRLRQLLEFSRAVHAEMDALLRAAREGTSTVGTRMFVTTYPCHYCARHIVAAGVDEVQYIEPYPKSRATRLHRDAITPEPHQLGPTERGW